MNVNELLSRIRTYSGLYIDSRQVCPGSVFVALQGAQTDGHRFIPQALAAGAAVVVCNQGAELPPPQGEAIYIKVADTHSVLAPLACAYYDHPSRKLKLVGITGTNGKTTTATLLYRSFQRLGYACGLLSTICNYVGNRRYETHNTTPDILEINRLLSLMCQAGCQYCFMEVSSHALDQGRTDGLHFAGALFSNLTHDHLDYHHSFAEYARCKKRFFDNLEAGAFALVNTDDRQGRVMVQNTAARVYTYAVRSAADFKIRIKEHSAQGMLLELDGRELWTRLLGKHNAYNLGCVYATARLLGAQEEELLPVLSALETVPGRLDTVSVPGRPTAVIDYAHTPDALENVLRTLRECLAPGGQLICVVGCGGDRDKTKRPEMARIGARLADRLFLTSDNPRTEEPGAILADMRAGLQAADLSKTLCITLRDEAIRAALQTAGADDLVLIAGKGHEDYQEIHHVRHHFDDKEIAKEVLCSII